MLACSGTKHQGAQAEVIPGPTWKAVQLIHEDPSHVIHVVRGNRRRRRVLHARSDLHDRVVERHPVFDAGVAHDHISRSKWRWHIERVRNDAAT